MSETIHQARDDEGRGHLAVTSFSGGAERGAMLQFTIENHKGAEFVALTYPSVEELYNALGAWLLDRLLSGYRPPHK